MKPNYTQEAVNNSSDILREVTPNVTANDNTTTSDSPKSTRVRTIQVSEETAEAIELYLEIAKLYNVSYNYADRRIDRIGYFGNHKATEEERDEVRDRYTEDFYPHITKMIERAEEYITGSVIDKLMAIDYAESNDTITI